MFRDNDLSESNHLIDCRPCLDLFKVLEEVICETVLCEIVATFISYESLICCESDSLTEVVLVMCWNVS